MKAYAIRDASIDKERDLAWLLYYEKERTFHIEVCDDVDEWDAPLILSSFVKHGKRALDPYWSRIWVEQRIVPSDRQNLGMILKENGLKEYDEYKLLVLADGRCAQDECFIKPLKAGSLPPELTGRLNLTLSSVLSTPDHTLLFFRDGLVKRLSDSALSKRALCEPFHSSEDLLARRLKLYRERLQELTLQPGGHGIMLGEDCYLSADTLREHSTAMQVTTEDFNSYIRQELIDTASAAELLGCTRQNIQDLVRRGKLRPVMTLKNNFLFLKGEIDLDKDMITNALVLDKSGERKTLMEYAAEFGGNLGPYEEFDWEEGMGIGRWLDAED